MSKHTKEPWNIVWSDAIVSEDGTWIKPHHHDSWEGERKWPTREEQEANTKLMAYAPKMKKALEDIINSKESDAKDIASKIIQEVDNETT